MLKAYSLPNCAWQHARPSRAFLESPTCISNRQLIHRQPSISHSAALFL